MASTSIKQQSSYSYLSSAAPKLCFLASLPSVGASSPNTWNRLCDLRSSNSLYFDYQNVFCQLSCDAALADIDTSKEILQKCGGEFTNNSPFISNFRFIGVSTLFDLSSCKDFSCPWADVKVSCLNDTTTSFLSTCFKQTCSTFKEDKLMQLVEIAVPILGVAMIAGGLYCCYRYFKGTDNQENQENYTAINEESGNISV